MADYTVICDFDGTVTRNDTVDHLLSLFADDRWLDIEKAWKSGEIGSRECLTKQLSCIDFISREQLDEFIESIEFDNYFIDFFQAVNNQNIEFFLVSDGFDMFIKNVLKKAKLTNIKVFSNMLNYNNGKLIPFFPFYNLSCTKYSGLCKCEIIKKYRNNRQVVYIGDGTSDICASKHADVLFAKNSLAEYCSNNNIKHIKFESFKDICEHLSIGDNLNVKTKIFV